MTYMSHKKCNERDFSEKSFSVELRLYDLEVDVENNRNYRQRSTVCMTEWKVSWEGIGLEN